MAAKNGLTHGAANVQFNRSAIEPWTKVKKRNIALEYQGLTTGGRSYEHGRCGQTNRGTSTGER
jgi:hypothetical protein